VPCPGIWSIQCAWICHFGYVRKLPLLVSRAAQRLHFTGVVDKVVIAYVRFSEDSTYCRLMQWFSVAATASHVESRVCADNAQTSWSLEAPVFSAAQRYHVSVNASGFQQGSEKPRFSQMFFSGF